MNVTQFVREHDRYVRENEPTPEQIAYHREIIAFIHRERLVHLQVTLAFGLFALLALAMNLMQPSLPLLALFLLLLVLLIPYIRHYFLLENHVQDWTLLLLRWEGRRPPRA